jgi:ribosomal protein L29
VTNDSIDDSTHIPVLTDVLVPGTLDPDLQQALIARTQELIKTRMQESVQHVLNRHMESLQESLREAVEELAREVVAQAIAEQTALNRIKSARRS